MEGLSAEAEVVRSQACVVIHEPAVVVEVGFGVIAACSNPIVAERLAELWNRHGIADAPDTAEGVCG